MDPNAPPWQQFLEHAELSDVGLRRSNNQDSFGRVIAASSEQWAQRGHLLMVADGMGAHAAGELASKMAVETVTHSYYKLLNLSPPEAIRKSVEEANSRIHSRGQANPDFKGMGTTTSALLILPEGAVVAHVGDSRVYRLRGNRFEQLSFDHSLVWEMTAGGRVPDREVPGYIPKNIITRSLGPSEKVQVDLEGPFPLLEGDTFLLCSDGLSGPVLDEELGTVLQALPPAEAVQTLVDMANLRGGPDNITVLIARVHGLDRVKGMPAAASRGPAAAAPPVSPLLLVACGVLLLAAGMLFFADQHTAAGAAAIAGLCVAIVLFWKRFATTGEQGVRLPSSPLGKGPHRTYICTPDGAFVEKLSEMIEPLRVEARQQQWDVDWARFDALCSEANMAAANGDYVRAVRADCRAISFMMEQVRDQRRKTNEDSALEAE